MRLPRYLQSLSPLPGSLFEYDGPMDHDEVLEANRPAFERNFEVQEFDLTRERIRQIEAKALPKLHHASRTQGLKGFIEE